MFGGWVWNVLSWDYRRLVMVENVDFRYETKDENHKANTHQVFQQLNQNKASPHPNLKGFFIEKGSSMSHWEFCLNKFNLSKEVFNQIYDYCTLLLPSKFLVK